MSASITEPLRRFEDRLPPIASGVLRLNLAIVDRTVSTLGAASRSMCAAADTVSRAVTTAGDATEQVAGQAKAQSRITSERARSETVERIDDAVDAIEDRPSGAYESWTKAELYDRAQELDIDGRSTMTKSELIDALRARS